MNPEPIDPQQKALPSPGGAAAKQGSSECVICCDAIADPCEVRPCNHRHFDYLCVATWLFSDARCPVCRASVETLFRDSTGEALTDFQASGPTLNVHPSPSSSSSQQQQRQSHRPRVPIRRGPRSRCRSRYHTPEEPSAALRRRQDVYLHARYSKHVGSNRLSRYRELTPQLFRDDEQLVSRARMWIRRELQVFAFLRPDPTTASSSASGDAAARRRHQNAEFLLEYIVAILKSVDLAGSAGEAENMLSEFLGRDNTRLFLHELRAWLRSPYTKLEDWDRAVQYETEPAASQSGGRGFDRGQRWQDQRQHDLLRRSRAAPDEEAERGESHRGRPGSRYNKQRLGYDRYVPSPPAGSGSQS